MQFLAQQVSDGSRAPFEQGALAARLAVLGFCTPLTCLPITPVWDQERRLGVARRILTMHSQCGARRAQQWTEGSLSLHLKPLDLGQPCLWLSERAPPPRALDGFVYSFACSFCGAVTTVETKPGRAHEGWAKLWCGGCQRTRRVGNHTCQ
eukprot:13529979-Alexandrium_andersonii.AAC.1